MANSSHHTHQFPSSTITNSNANNATPNTGSAAASTTAAVIGATRTGSGKFSNENDSECSSVTSDSMPGGWVKDEKLN